MTFTKQEQAWAGRFGDDYTQRNLMSVEETDAQYRNNFGITRTELNERFIGHLPRDARILEIGTNVGRQLGILLKQGFANLYGVELQWNAVDIARKNLPRANIAQGSAFDVPFKNGWFDVVFTSGVLIHLSPDDVGDAMREIHRCSRRYIWGMEYWAPKLTEVPYRGHDALLWKGDYAAVFQELFVDLKLVRLERFPYSDNPANVDAMFLLEKAG